MAARQSGPILRHIRRLITRPEALADHEMLERFALGHQEAFEALVRRHGPMVHGVCHRVLRDGHDAEDAFQATFLVLARRAGAIRNRQSVASWLYGVAYRVALKARARVARHRSREEPAIDPPAPADMSVAIRELRSLLDEELSRLPEKYRAPLVLCYLQGKTKDEAAAELGWPAGTVSGRLARARDLLRGRLERRGVALSAALSVTLLSATAASASLPAPLIHLAVDSAAALMAGKALAEVAPTPVTTLVEGVLREMFLTKAKYVAVVLVAVTLFGGGAWTLRALEKPPPVARNEAPPADKGDRDPKPVPVAEVKQASLTLRHKGEVHGVAFSPDGKYLATTSTTGPVQVFDVVSGRVVREFEQQTNQFTPMFHLTDLGVAFSPDSKLLAFQAYDAVCVHDIGTGRKVCQVPTQVYGGTRTTLAFSPDGKRLTTLSYSKETQELMKPKEAPRDPPKEQPKGAPRVGGFGGFPGMVGGPDMLPKMTEWELPAGKMGEQKGATSFTFSANGKYVALYPSSLALFAQGQQEEELTIRVQEAATGKEIARCKIEHKALLGEGGGFGYGVGMTSLILSPDGKRLAIGNGGTGGIRIIGTATGQLIRELPQSKYCPVESVAFSPDGRTLVAVGGAQDFPFAPAPGGFGGFGEMNIIAAPPGKEDKQRGKEAQPEGNFGRFGGGAPAPKPGDKVCPLWEIASGKVRCRLIPSDKPCTVAFASDGKRLATGSRDKAAQVWDLPKLLATKAPTSDEAEALWAGLADADAERAYRVTWTLSADPALAVPLLRKHLRDLPGPDAKRLAALIADLDGKDFATRQKAGEELEKLGLLAVRALQQTLATKPAAEVAKRIEKLLERAAKEPPAAEQLRIVRALELLELVATPDAKEVIKSVAEAKPETWLTEEARASFERLDGRSAKK